MFRELKVWVLHIVTICRYIRVDVYGNTNLYKACHVNGSITGTVNHCPGKTNEDCLKMINDTYLVCIIKWLLKFLIKVFFFQSSIFLWRTPCAKITLQKNFEDVFGNIWSWNWFLYHSIFIKKITLPVTTLGEY